MNEPDLYLRVQSSLVNRAAPNFRPSSWPPPPEFPIVIDANGVEVCRFADQVWNLTPWAGEPCTLNFGDGPKLRTNCPPIDRNNADLLRLIVFEWLYGTRGIRTTNTYRGRFTVLRQVFSFCASRACLASDLYRFPKLVDELPRVLKAGIAKRALGLLHRIYERRDFLGFQILDREGLRRFEAALPETPTQQTPYIPPRIWNYQVGRLRAFLDDFDKHRNGIEECYQFCLEQYIKYHGSVAMAFSSSRNNNNNPFNDKRRHLGDLGDRQFQSVAARFGIKNLIEGWCTAPEMAMPLGIKTFSKYLSGVGHVGLRYIINFSLMRISEAQSLRADCLLKEIDDRFGPIFLICGETTKTDQDSDARWVTSPSAEVAVTAMAAVARLRMSAARLNPHLKMSASELSNPKLVTRAYEPWSGGSQFGGYFDTSIAVRLDRYNRALEAVPRIFDERQLRITPEDLRLARLVTPTLDVEQFEVGKMWPFSNHQLRRTGAVNMQASGLISEASLQYQLKHTTRACSLYYGQGYSRVRLNEDAGAEYIRTMYEVMTKELQQLFSERYVSPLGAVHKQNILRLIAPKDSKKLAAAAKAGRISYRETLLGGCLHHGPCPYGGIDNIVRCGGGDGKPGCPDALFDRARIVSIERLRAMVCAQLANTPAATPLHASLEAQQCSIDNALKSFLDSRDE